MHTPPSKTAATWIAVFGGSLGLHRFYLHGWRDRWGWLHPVPTLVGSYGAWRLHSVGLDDALGSLLVPLLGLMLSIAMLSAIVYGLTPEEKWQNRWGVRTGARASGWAAVFGVVVALLIGSTVLMATAAFSGQRLFEMLAEQRQAKSFKPTQ